MHIASGLGRLPQLNGSRLGAFPRWTRVVRVADWLDLYAQGGHPEWGVASERM